MALSEAPSSAGALVAPQYGEQAAHTHAVMGGGKKTHAHDDGGPGHGHPADRLLPLPRASTRGFHLDLDIKSVSETPTGTLVLTGYASTWAGDRDQERFARQAFEQAIDQYMLNPVLLLGHKRDHEIGYMAERPVLDRVGVSTVAHVPKPPQGSPAWHIKAYHDIKNRVLRALSVGGIFRKDAGVIHGMDWCETSVVSVPSNPFSIFEVAEQKGLRFDLTAKAADPSRTTHAGAHTHTREDGSALTHRHPAAVVGHRHGGMAASTAAAGMPVKQAKETGASDETADPADEADEIERRGDLGALMQGLLEALNEVADSDDLSEPEKVANVEAILGEFCDEAATCLPDMDMPDDESPAKWAHALAVKAGNHPLTNALAPYARAQEADMADETGQGAPAATDTKAAPTPKDDDIAISGAQAKSLLQQLEVLMAEKRERELEAKADAEAERRVKADAEAKQAAETAQAVETKKLNDLVEQKLAAMTSGRKYVMPQTSSSPTGREQRKHLGQFMRDIVRAKRGDFEAFQRLEEGHKEAADFFELDTKAIGESTGAGGGYLVPPQYMQNGIAEFRIAASKLRPLVTVEQTNSNVVYLPRSTGIASVGWVAENVAKPSTDQNFGQIAVNIFTLAGIIKVSKQLVDDSNPLVDGIVRRDLGRLLGQAEDIAMLAGTGVGQPTGILLTTGVLTVAIGDNSIFDGVSALLTAVETNYFGQPNALVAHPRSVQTMRTKKDANGRYLADPGYVNGMGVADRSFYGDAQSPAAIGTVWGLPLISDANMPTNFTGVVPGGAGAESPIIAGYYPEAWLLERQGVQIDMSGEAGTSFEANQYWFRGEVREGFTAARQPTAFAALTGLLAAAG